MDPRVVPLAEILRLNTKLYRNCLHGMTQAQAEARPGDGANSALWVAAHMAKSRYYLLKRLGAERANPLPADLMNAKSVDDVTRWPAVTDVLAAWTNASHALRDRLPLLAPADLDAKVEVRFPVFEQTEFGVLVFLVQHDSYHLGQLSILRKVAGLPGMSYTDPA
jgi:uncharacterized damage-inducible protein DinB